MKQNQTYETQHINLTPEGNREVAPELETTDINEAQDNQIQFVMVNGEPQRMTPYNTLITYYKPDYTVDRKATIKSFSQYYGAELVRNTQKRAKAGLRLAGSALRNAIDAAAEASRTDRPVIE